MYLVQPAIYRNRRTRLMKAEEPGRNLTYQPCCGWPGEVDILHKA